MLLFCFVCSSFCVCLVLVFSSFFAYCGLLGNSHTTANMLIFAPLPTSTKTKAKKRKPPKGVGPSETSHRMFIGLEQTPGAQLVFEWGITVAADPGKPEQGRKTREDLVATSCLDTPFLLCFANRSLDLFK